MPNVLKLRAKIAEKRSAAQKILDAVAAEPIVRDLSPEEKTKFDGLMADVTTLKGQVSQLLAIEGDQAADEEMARSEQAAAAERSVRRSPEVGEAPAVHSGPKPYSILRALRLATDQKPLDGVEGECSRQIARRSGKDPKGFFLPVGLDPDLRRLMNGGKDPQPVRRDLTTTTGAGSIFTLPELPFIDLLRAKLVVRQLGATFLTDMKGVFAIPRQTSSSTVYWVAEGNPASASNQQLDQVPFTPKVAIALTNLSRKFMNQTSLDAEQFVKDDLAATMARELDRVALNGSGGTQPTGMLQNSTVQANGAGLALGTNGGALTFAAVVAMEAQVANYNADRGKLAYLTSPALRGELKTAQKTTGGYPIFIYEDGTEAGVGEINGYPAYATTNVPSNLTKGTGTALKAIIYGTWQDLVVAQWEGVNMLVNPYTNQASGGVVISMEMSVNTEVRHPESFAIITDAT